MKSFLKIIIIVFSILILAFSVVSILVLSDIISIEQIKDVTEFVCTNSTINAITYAIAILLGLLSIVAIIGSDVLTNDMKGGIILPLTIGSLNISTQTFENIVLNVSKKYGSIKTTKVGVKITSTGVMVDLFVYVLQDTVISDITEKLQEDIKETVLKQTTVAVNSVNVKVKGIYTLAEPKES